MTLPSITFDKVSFKTPDLETPILSDISFDIIPNQVTCLLGASGSGKSTILQMIAGLLTPNYGNIVIRDKLVSSQNILKIKPQDRNIAFMFQDYALIPFMSVLENIYFVIQGRPDNQQKVQAEKILKDVGLWHYKDHSAAKLSGGEQQRLALARSLMQNTDIVMLDEPFSNLDSALRRRLRTETLQILKQNQKTVIMVTHDPSEAFLSADHIIYLSNGKIIQSGAPQEIYQQPLTADIAAFSGAVNIFTGSVKNNMLDTPIGQFTYAHSDISNAQIVIRHEGFLISPLGDDAQIQAKIIHKEFAGNYYHVTLKIHETEFIAQLPASEICDICIDEQIGLLLMQDALFVFPA